MSSSREEEEEEEDTTDRQGQDQPTTPSHATVRFPVANTLTSHTSKCDEKAAPQHTTPRKATSAPYLSVRCPKATAALIYLIAGPRVGAPPSRIHDAAGNAECKS